MLTPQFGRNTHKPFPSLFIHLPQLTHLFIPSLVIGYFHNSHYKVLYSNSSTKYPFEIIIEMSRHISCSMNSTISLKTTIRSYTNTHYSFIDPSQTQEYAQNAPCTNKHIVWYLSLIWYKYISFMLTNSFNKQL